LSATIDGDRGQVLAALPLALLEAVRDQDRPVEVLDAEDLAVSLPRRLGLTGVVSSQIHRYQLTAASGAWVPFAELASLLRLVLRRPDAGSILRETGRRLARQRIGERPPLSARALRRFRGLAYIPARRAAKGLLRGIVADGRVAITGKTMVVRVRQAPTLELGTQACELYTGALEELIRLYCGKPREVVHNKCAARGDALCEWSVVE
jgi:hypothetical protein